MQLVGDPAFYKTVRGFSSLRKPIETLWRGLKAKGFFDKNKDCWGCKSRALVKSYGQVLRAFTKVFVAIHDKEPFLLQDMFVYFRKHRDSDVKNIVCFHKENGEVRKLEVYNGKQ